MLKRVIKLVLPFFIIILLFSCSNPSERHETENTPTSGHLTICFEEGLEKHVRNQAFTFESIYYKASLDLIPTNEDLAIQALYLDSCEAIVITRLLSEKERMAFASKKYTPNYSRVAKTGIALICNADFGRKKMRYDEVLDLVNTSNQLSDSLGVLHSMNLLIDKSGSAIHNYLKDSLLKKDSFPSYFSSLNSGPEAIRYVETHKNALAFIEFALLSDVDDSLSKAVSKNIRILALGARKNNGRYEQPNQSSFKLNTYPFIRNVYVMRKTGDFTLAKGFESFVAGPKGQTIFLKQGLLPERQQERSINVRLEPLNVNQ